MKYSTHLLFGGAVSQIIAVFTGYPTTILSGSLIGSLLPDIDQPKSYIGRRVPYFPEYINNRWGHRTISHSLKGFMITFMALMPLNLFKILYFSGSHLWLGAIVGYLSHLLADALNPCGISLLYPDSQKFKLYDGPIDIGSKKESLFAMGSSALFLGCLSFNLIRMIDIFVS